MFEERAAGAPGLASKSLNTGKRSKPGLPADPLFGRWPGQPGPPAARRQQRQTL